MAAADLQKLFFPPKLMVGKPEMVIAWLTATDWPIL